MVERISWLIDAFHRGVYRVHAHGGEAEPYHRSMLRRIDLDTLLWVATLMLAVAIGVCIGCLWSYVAHDAEPLMTVPGTRDGIATVTLEGFRDGLFRGRSSGTIRLFVGDDPVEIAPDGSFAMDHPGFHIEEVTVRVPSGMAFVASKKGKKYYGVTSAGGERIAPNNRVYFPDARSAEAAGYRR